MKKPSLFRVCVTLLAVLCQSCSDSEPATYDTTIIVLIDQTDPLVVYPDVKKIMGYTGFTDDIWTSATVTVSTLTDMNISPEYSLSIPSESKWLGNKSARQSDIEAFTNELTQKLDTLRPLSFQPLRRSVILVPLITHLNALAEQKGDRHILVYSNLFENSSFSFYDPLTLKMIESMPKEFKKQVEEQIPISDLEGITIHFIYKPGTREDNSRYCIISRFLTKWFSEKGAKVIVSAQ